jgi:hypothetical protein
MPLGNPAPVPADYIIFVTRSQSFPQAELWPFTIRDSIPPLHVPLDSSDADAIVDLQNCVTECFDGAKYERLINYNVSPTPPLREPDYTWARERLAVRLRGTPA